MFSLEKYFERDQYFPISFVLCILLMETVRSEFVQNILLKIKFILRINYTLIWLTLINTKLWKKHWIASHFESKLSGTGDINFSNKRKEKQFKISNSSKMTGIFMSTFTWEPKWTQTSLSSLQLSCKRALSGKISLRCEVTSLSAFTWH